MDDGYSKQYNEFVDRSMLVAAELVLVTRLILWDCVCTVQPVQGTAAVQGYVQQLYRVQQQYWQLVLGVNFVIV